MVTCRLAPVKPSTAGFPTIGRRATGGTGGNCGGGWCRVIPRAYGLPLAESGSPSPGRLWIVSAVAGSRDEHPRNPSAFSGVARVGHRSPAFAGKGHGWPFPRIAGQADELPPAPAAGRQELPANATAIYLSEVSANSGASVDDRTSNVSVVFSLYRFGMMLTNVIPSSGRAPGGTGRVTCF